MSAPLVEEIVVTLVVNGTQAYQWRCTPTDLEALAIGRLYIDGLIASADDAHVIVTPIANEAINIQTRIDRNTAMRIESRGNLGIPHEEAFIVLFRALFNTVDARHEHGGMHAAAITDGQRILVQLEDVGRHNTVDKIVGAVLLARQNPADYGLLTSSRVSGEIAHKAARAGFAWLASRSIPTTLAVRIANEAHMPIIGRAAARTAYIYQ